VLLRLTRLAAVIIAVSALTFLLSNLLPGDPAVVILGESASPTQVAELRSQLGLDRPLPVRYLDWAGSAATGDLGTAYRSGRSVTELVTERLPVSLELMVLAQVLALVLAVPAAITSVRHRNGVFDRTLTSVSFGLLSAPSFVIAVLMIYLFSVRLGWLPATGFVRLSDDVVGNLRSVAMPAIVLALGPFAMYTRILRSDLSNTLQEDFVLVARSYGLPDRKILWGHALRPSLLPLVTLVGVNVGALIGGAVIIEQLFAIPGVGSLLIESILAREYLVLQGVVLLIAVGYVLVNFLVDICYGILDPRIRHAHR
jgi:peptide/nickel transport system permease protein